ncbi:LOW QUALITY PROTEIN: exocyst complex component 4-like [Liolophura sinensis]|uniref:LOW QUALITY PROTEIN: exocyst complex component 4-like n=1 Tax=Liolophura sinensis TaxID=3198878 RepID=UPI0031593284
MSIVRTLSSSADFEQREKEKARIEKAFRESDKKLGELVTGNYKDLMTILQSFSTVYKKITDSREKIKKIKEDLSSCKTLLHCKRDDLRRLWIEGVEHKTVVAMLDQIEDIKEVLERIDEHMARKHYLHATDMMVSAVAKLEGPLSGIDALKELRSELNARKEQMHEVLIEELNRVIYVKGTSAMAKAPQKTGSIKAKKGAGSVTDMPNVDEFNHITEDLNVDPEENIPKYMAILTESLYVLRKLPEAVEALKARIHPELLAIVNRASQQVVDIASQQGETLSTLDQPRYLLELLEMVFQQFRCVATMHKLMLSNLRRIQHSAMESVSSEDQPEKNMGGSKSDQLIRLYDMVDVWSKIEAVLQLLLGDYLDIRNTAANSQQTPNNFDEPSQDIGTYFARKRSTRPKKPALFRFDASSHAISMNNYLREQRHYDPDDVVGGSRMIMDIGSPQFVCKPGADNITAIFNPLQSFIKEIDAAMSSSNRSGSSSLQLFVKEFVQQVFLVQVHFQVTNSIDSATKEADEEGSSPRDSGFDALRNTIDQKTQKELGVTRPLLQSTVTVDRNIQKLHGLMLDLPDYADQFLNMICNILQEYRETCHSAYRGIVQLEVDEKRIISAMWAKDDDINRFLRSLPSWKSLQPTEGQELNRTICSEEEMRALNSKESVILISNLSSADSLIPQNEIITDITQMRTVANLHESLEWFCSRLRSFAASLSPSTRNGVTCPDENHSDIPPVSQEALQSLKNVAQDFQNLAEICLLLLHLEVRVHCFYYLLPVAKQSNYAGAIDDLDPDSNVLKLNKDLSSVEEVLTQSLQPRKFRYIFESLGFLVASILINSVQFLKKINENGVKKMCRNIFAVQQNLTNITQSREADLDHARQFYELIYSTPDEIINDIAEKGAQFTESEYSQLLRLMGRSQPGSDPAVLSSRLTRLRETLQNLQNESG